MNRLKKISFVLGILALAIAPENVFACAACFGKNDSAMAQGMNAGIFSLLAIVGTVLFGAAAFGIYLVRRAAKFSQAAQNNNVSAQPQI